MTEYDNTNRGVLFKNENKESDNHPDYSGNLNVDGAEFFMDGWLKKSAKSGKSFLSIRIKPKQQRAQGRGSPPPRQAPQRQAPRPEPEFSDDIPF